MDDEDIKKFLFDTWIEDEIRHYEDLILKLMKTKQENYPSEYNDKVWLDFLISLVKEDVKRRYLIF